MDVNVRDFGAVADGVTNNAESIQRAIDACFASGGGRVVLSDGIYMTGSIVLKSNIELHVAGGAVLLGSPRCEDYPEKQGLCHVISENLPRRRNASLIFAENAENIAITGKGRIDCNGKHFVVKKEGEWTGWQYERIDAPTPPRVVFFAGCRRVRVEDITMVNQPSGWSYWIHDCDLVTFDKCTVLAEVEYPNNDGIHINSSRDVTISDCYIESGDDSIVVRANNRSLSENKICERVTVRNCRLRSYTCCIRIAWTCDGVIRNCSFSDIEMSDSNKGICLQLPYIGDISVAPDQGREATRIEDISFENIVMSDMYASPIFLCIDPNAAVLCDTVRNITFRNIRAEGLLLPYIKGRPENPIENVRLENCTFRGITEEKPELYLRHGEAKWCRPASGHMFGYVKNIEIRNSSFDLV
ncbi:MAG: right-handed parallel beta-helix repeat-containing protein [Clostridia bacterium]|nr:right-handed parallel beta-helix repeat-containing protein [Clostridia bacterium]